MTGINLMPQIFTRVFLDGNSGAIVPSHLICCHVYFDLQNLIIRTFVLVISTLSGQNGECFQFWLFAACSVLFANLVACKL